MNHRTALRLWVVALAVAVVGQLGCRAREAQTASTPTLEDFAALEDKIDGLTAEVRAALGNDGDINIVLTGKDTNVRLLELSHKSKGVCKNPVKDCENGVTWRLIGANRMPKSWSVKIEERQQGTSTTGCFNKEYVLGANAPDAPSGPPHESCQKADVIWRYDVILYDGSQKPVGDPIDPLLLMYY